MQRCQKRLSIFSVIVDFCSKSCYNVRAQRFNNHYIGGDLMKKGRIIRYSNQEDLIRAFAGEVVGNFNRCLELWMADSVDGETEKDILKRKLYKQSKVIWENVFDELAKILTDDTDKRYAKKLFGPFKSKRYVVITWDCGFYDHLLKGAPEIEGKDESIRDLTVTNVEYILDREKFTLEWRYLPEENPQNR